jgi:hypothetical protein
MVSHMPYRSWCRHCVAGKGKADAHRSSGTASSTVPTVHMDYGFLGQKLTVERLERDTIPFVVVKDGPPPLGSRWVDSHVVQSKGVLHEYSAKVVAQDIVRSGYGNFIFKSDGEVSILALKRAAVSEVRRMGHEVTVQPEESPVGDSQKNGYVERAIWEVQSTVRTLIHAANEMHGVEFDVRHPVVAWAVRYAGQLLSRFQKAHDDGKTAFERRKGRPYKRRLPSFAELVMFMTVADRAGPRRKLDERFSTGMYVGLVERTDEVIVLTEDGYFRVNTVKRVSEEQRGNKVFALACRGCPWDGEGAHGDEFEGVEPFRARVMEVQTQICLHGSTSACGTRECRRGSTSGARSSSRSSA